MTTTPRSHLVAAVRTRLTRRASPRLHMSALVLVTGAAGLLTSVALLQLGLTAMAVRWPLAVGVAYAVFLGLLGLWLRRFRLQPARRPDDPAASWMPDVMEVPLDALFVAPDVESPYGGFGQGGGFAGGGSDDAWGGSADASIARADVGPAQLFARAHEQGVASDWGLPGLEVDDEGWLGAVWVLAITGMALGTVFYLVYAAPVFLAELLLDAALAAGVYGRLHAGDAPTWRGTALRRTLLPAIVIAVLLGGAGAVLQHLAPGAVSLGPVLEQLRTSAPSQHPRAT